MAEVATLPAAKPVPLAVLVRGKIASVRRHENVIHTVVLCPAKDEYSRPATVEVRSKQRIGEAESIVSVECELGGYPHNWTNNKTGEEIRSARLTLDLVD